MFGAKNTVKIKKNYEISPGVPRFSSARLSVPKIGTTVVKDTKAGGKIRKVINKGVSF